MRVISGTKKGKNLLSPQGIDIRPTSDRTKEAIFSMLMPYLSGAQFLDLFCGTGAIGIEALSRGASKAFFIDSDSSSIEITRQNLVNTNFQDSSEIIFMDYLNAIDTFSNDGTSLDIIFMDPPYRKGFSAEALAKICVSNILSDDGIIVVEEAMGENVKIAHDALKLFKEKKYGKTSVFLFKLQ